MDAQQFLAEFGHIANAPGGMARLKELVLQLAISGRLVLRDGNETPIRESIEKAREQRRRYERDNELRLTHTRKSTGTNLYSIPEHWQWEALENLALYIQRGKSPKYAESGKVRVVSQKCVQWAGFDITAARYIADDSLRTYGDERFLRGGDLLWNSTGTGTVGRVAICHTQQETYCVADSHVTVIRLSDIVLPRYLWCVIASPWVQTRFQPTHPDSLVSGTTQQVEFSTSAARALPVPVPPVEEQVRIVAKVDELMALCDKLEDEQQKRRKLQNTLRQVTLQAVAKAQSPHELQASWARLEANFGRLFSASDQVSNLRQLILDLAINGRLSERNSSDEPVGELVRRCKDEKQRRLTDGEMKRKVSAATDVVQSQVAFPEQWTCVPLEDLFQFIDYRGNTPPKTSSGVALVTAKNIRPGRLNPEPKEYISDSSYRDWMTRGFPRVGDLLFTTEAPLGNVARIEGSANFALAQRVIDFQPYADINTQCAMYFMMSPTFQDLLEVNSTGMTAKGIKAAKLKRIEFPVPPVSEQARIVEKVESLLQLCDVLDEHLEESAQVAARLSNAAVSSITGIAIEQEEDEPVKVPQTELISRLRLGQAPSVKVQAPLASLLARHNGELSAQDLWQRYGGEIDAFYAQLKTEVAHGWIEEPAVAEVREKPLERAEA